MHNSETNIGNIAPLHKAAKQRPPRTGYFEIDRSFLNVLTANRVSVTALAALLVLLAASDETNLVSRAGIQAIRKILGIGPATARNAVTELIEAGAISPIAMDNPRDMTAPRFRILQPSGEPVQIGEPDAVLSVPCASPPDRLYVSNALVRSDLGMSLLRTCIKENDRGLLTLALLLHADPLGVGNVPLIVRQLTVTAGPIFGMFRIGYVASFLEHLVIPDGENALLVNDHRMRVLASLGIMEWGLFTVSGPDAVARRQPVGTLRFGVICRESPDGQLAALVQMLAAHLGEAPAETSTRVAFLYDAIDPPPRVVAIPRLRLLPDIRSVKDAHDGFKTDCRLRTAMLEDIVSTACPELADQIGALLRKSGKASP